MSGLLDLLNSPMGKQLINGTAQQTGQPEDKTALVGERSNQMCHNLSQ